MRAPKKGPKNLVLTKDETDPGLVIIDQVSIVKGRDHSSTEIPTNKRLFPPEETPDEETKKILNDYSDAELKKKVELAEMRELGLQEELQRMRQQELQFVSVRAHLNELVTSLEGQLYVEKELSSRLTEEN